MKTCAKEGCQKEVDPKNGKYCSKECSPYFKLSLEQDYGLSARLSRYLGAEEEDDESSET